MKKIYALLICAAFAVAGCEENKPAAKQESAAVAAPAKAAVEAPVQAAAPAVATAAAPAQIENVDWAKAIEMNKAGALFVDVRTPGEVAEGMVEGAVNIPLQEIQHRIAEFPKDRDLLIYCRSGKRSMAASNFLIDNGYTRVFNVVGGFLAYPQK